MTTGSIGKNGYRADLSRQWAKTLFAVLLAGLAFFLPCHLALAQNTSVDPDPDSETPGYISMSLNQDIVAVGDPLSGSATIYEGDGSVDSEDPITATPDSGSPTGSMGTVNFNIPTTVPGDISITAASKDASSQSKAGHAVAVNAVLTPADNFKGRSQTSYGVAEIVNLSVTTSPAGYEGKIGTLRWSGSGDGTTSDSGGGSGVFSAGDVAGSANIVLSVTSGPLNGKSYSKSRTIVAPSGVTLVNTGDVLHTPGTASAGFYALTYLTPKDVSFSNIEEEEEYSAAEWDAGKVGPKAVTTGAYSIPDLDNLPHKSGGYNRAGSGNINTGCLIGGNDTQDHVWSGKIPVPVSEDGDFTWTIPRDYRVARPGSTVHSGYTTLVQHQHVTKTDAAGNTVTTIEKGGISVSATETTPPTH